MLSLYRIAAAGRIPTGLPWKAPNLYDLLLEVRMIDRTPIMRPQSPGPDPRQRLPGETDEGYVGRMARLFETDLARRLMSFLFAGGLFFLGTDLAMLFITGRVEGMPDFPLMPLWGPILSLGVIILGVRILRRLSAPRRRTEPQNGPDNQLIGPE